MATKKNLENKSEKEIRDQRIPFDQLPISTATMMAYSNINLSISDVFRNLDVADIEAPLTKKKKTVDKKNLNAPYGSILSLQYYIYIRGIRTSKKKKYWCPSCQFLGTRPSGREFKILTVEEHEHYLSEEELLETNYPPDTQKIHFICYACDKEFKITQLRQIVPFLNQVTIVLSLGDININIMMFKDNFKIAGNKKINDAVETIMILWENYLRDLKQSWNLLEGHTDAHFLFDLVMANVDFETGFSIDKIGLNNLMNSEEYADTVKMSLCENTSTTHVNIKLYAIKPSEFRYNVLVYPDAKKYDCENPFFSQMEKNPYARKAKSSQDIVSTLIAFSSGKTILTSRYFQAMAQAYNFYLDVTAKHRDEIEEKIYESDKPFYEI